MEKTSFLPQTLQKEHFIAHKYSESKNTTNIEQTREIETKIALLKNALLPKIHKETEPTSYTVEVLHGCDVPKNIILKIAEQFREDFGSTKSGGWGEYKKCPCKDCSQKVSIEACYKLQNDTYVPLNALETSSYSTPNCTVHEVPMVDYWPLDEKVKELEDKFAKEYSRVGILFDQKKEVCGYTIGYATPMQDAWNSEFQKLTDQKDKTTFENYMKGCSIALGYEFTPATPVWVWNTTGIRFPARTRENSHTLRKTFAENIPAQCLEYTSPGDTSLTGNLICNLIPAGMVTISKSPLFPDIVFVLFARTMREIRDAFCEPAEIFDAKHGEEYKMLKALKKNNWQTLGTNTDLEKSCLEKIIPIIQ